MVAHIIGLSGYARSGKNEAASVLVEKFRYRQTAFADKLRDVLYALNPLVDVVIADDDYYPWYLQEVINAYGWNGYKRSPFNDGVRRLVQRMGTEAGRNLLGEDIWVDATFNDIKKNENVVITDCRFENEARAVLLAGGEMWRIEREGVGPVNDHPSEVAIDSWPFDRVIKNNGDLDTFRAKVEAAYLHSV